jgi:hypothetical protein
VTAHETAPGSVDNALFETFFCTPHRKSRRHYVALSFRHSFKRNAILVVIPINLYETGSHPALVNNMTKRFPCEL